MGRNKNKEISAALFKKVAPLLPVVVASAKGGRPRVSDEMALNGILFVLRTGIPWEELPQELGFGSGMTCWRRLRDWQAAGVWHRLHLLLLDELRGAGKLDFSRASMDAASVASPRGANTLAPTRRTGASSAASATSSRSAKASLRSFASRAPIGMTRSCSSNWSMPCRRCAAVVAGPDAGRTSCMPTRAMTLRVAAPTCASWASRRVLPGVASSAMTGSGVIVGWSSARPPGWLPWASCGLALSAASTFISRCFLWLAASSAFAILHRFVSRSKNSP